MSGDEALDSKSQGKKSDRTAEQMAAMLAVCKGYDYVRFTHSSLLGEQYLKAVPARHLSKFLRTGMHMWEGMTLLGPVSDIFHSMFDIVGSSNLNMMPQPGTFHALPWATKGKYKVGAFLCEPVYQTSGLPLTADARYAARQQIQRLEDRGLNIRSGFEMEFVLLDKATKSEPICEKKIYASANRFAAIEEFVYSADEQLYESGVNMENMLDEYGPGQVEFVLAPAEGIDAPDQVFKLKQGVREIALQHDMCATFMTMPFIGIGNGMHFNHSIIDMAGNNVCYDGTKLENLSEFARHWIGGLMKHAKALSALCCSTVNCFRRIGAPWAPGKVNWGVDDRCALLRVKNNGAESTYFENRLPGGSANPYLVLAATIAAGLDGVEKKIECPPAVPLEKAEDKLPSSLKEAIEFLKEDTVMCTALGDTLIQWFIAEKEGSQFESFPDWSNEDQSELQMAKERNTYLEYI